MLRFLFVTMACLALASCKTAGEASAENKTGDAERSIYYKSQAAADTALAAFDKDNPSCQLWTNWQKMCSRTGEGGRSAYCSTDQSRAVKPTRPFCVGDFGGRYREPKHLKLASDNALLNVFCTKFEYVSGQKRCLKLDPKRPFNGRSLGAMRHPACEVWQRDDKPVCSETGKFPELPLCASVAQDRQEDSTFSCATENPKLRKFGCTGVAGPNDYSAYPPPLPSGSVDQTEDEGNIVFVPERVQEAIVHSIYCDSWELR